MAKVAVVINLDGCVAQTLLSFGSKEIIAMEFGGFIYRTKDGDMKHPLSMYDTPPTYLAQIRRDKEEATYASSTSLYKLLQFMEKEVARKI